MTLAANHSITNQTKVTPLMHVGVSNTKKGFLMSIWGIITISFAMIMIIGVIVCLAKDNGGVPAVIMFSMIFIFGSACFWGIDNKDKKAEESRAAYIHDVKHGCDEYGGRKTIKSKLTISEERFWQKTAWMTCESGKIVTVRFINTKKLAQ